MHIPPELKKNDVCRDYFQKVHVHSPFLGEFTDSNKTLSWSRSRGSLIGSDSDFDSWLVATTLGDSDSDADSAPPLPTVRHPAIISFSSRQKNFEQHPRVYPMTLPSSFKRAISECLRGPDHPSTTEFEPKMGNILHTRNCNEMSHLNSPLLINKRTDSLLNLVPKNSSESLWFQK